jgi:cytochrome bd-type quinol oxidase subunit 2
MQFVFNLVVVLHFVGLALLLGAFLVQVKDPNKTVTRWMWDGALTQLLTGLIMVGMISSGLLGDEEKEGLNHVKIGIKLVIVIVIAILAFIGKKKPAPQVGLWATIGLLTLANVVIAVFV